MHDTARISADPAGSVTARYEAGVRNRAWLLAGLTGLLLLIMVLALAAGPYPLSFHALSRSLFGFGQGTEGIVVWSIRMPRIAAALVSGSALGLSGIAIQSLLKNPLASPFTLGISQGAAFGAAFAIVVLGAGGLHPESMGGGSGSTVLGNLTSVTMLALAGAMISTSVILLLSLFRRLPPESIILAGVALSSLFVSGTILVQYFASEVEIASVVFWTFGDVSRSTWPEILTLTAATVVITAFFVLNRWNMNAMAAGEDVARGLGIGVDKLRLSGMFMASLAAALVTAFHGVIAFLGLLAPHIARRLVGSDHRLLIPCSCLVGAILLLGADLLGRCMAGSGSLPVGVLTSFMGAPLFLYLLIRGKTR